MASTIRVEIEGNRIRLTGWIGPETPSLCKEVGGGRFSKSGGPHWSYALDMSTCRRLREVFGKRLEIGPALNAWARAAVEQEKELLALAASGEATLTRLPERAPKIAAAMENRTYQQVAAAFGARTQTFGLFDQPGLGKTIETLGALVEGSPGEGRQFHLIFAPKVAVPLVWVPEVAHWLPESAVAFALVGTHAEREARLSEALAYRGDAVHVFVVANIEMARIKPTKTTDGKRVFSVDNAEYPALFAREWDSIIVDESHRALIRTKGEPTQQRAGFNKLQSRRRIALSGTPMRGKPAQLWGTLNWLRPDLFTSYWNWVGRYFEIKSNGYSDYVLGKLQAGAEERMQRDLAPLLLRRTKSEVLSELPPKQYAGSYLIPGDDHSPLGVWLEMTHAHRKQYETFIKEGELDFDNGDFLIANGELAEYTRRKQLSSAVHKMIGGKLTPTIDSPKFEWLVQKLDELGISEDGEGNAKIVVASQFTSLLNVFAAGLRERGIPLHLLTGETSEKSRVAMVQDFQSDKSRARVFLLNTKAGGVAVTLDAADDLVLLDETTVPDDQEQVEDRVHRTSRIHNVTIHYLRTLGTQDEEIAWVAAARENIQKYLLDGTRGVEYAKRLYQENRNKA
jgi:SNF2 family DNA or RNA helicase